MAVDRQLYEIFYEGVTHYAEGSIDGEGKVKYSPVKGIPSLKSIQAHLRGEHVLGSYTVLPGNMVRWMAFDVDSKKGLDEARKIAKKICQCFNADKYILEFSGNKGYHIILIFEEPVLAKDAKRLGEELRDSLGFSKRGDIHVEVFPKQEELKLVEDKKTGEVRSELGNLLRLPLGKHPKTKSDAIFVTVDDWVTPLDPEIELAKRVTLDDLKKAIKDEDPKNRVMGILLPYWNDGQRHDIALCTSGYMASLGWTEEDTEDLIELIHNSGGYGELRDQLNTVKTTYKRYYNGESVLGFQGLSEILSAKSLNDLVEWGSRYTSSTIMQMIDRFRLEKESGFKKVRKSVSAIISYLKESGKLVTDGSNIYWLNREISEVILLEGPLWVRLAYNEFGLNIADSFGRQVMEGLKHLSAKEAVKINVYKRLHFDIEKGIVYLSLGGKEVYVFNGNKKERRAILNGEEDIMFLNSQDTLCMPNLLEDEESSTIDPWEYLVNTINFKSGDNIQATPIQQREMSKAYMMAILFKEVLATRPILTILGAAGSGKTTVLRKFLRFLEGPDQEVLGAVPDKPDSFRASLEKHLFLALDNLEKTNASWLPDMFNRISTGTHIEIRKLHTTNETHKIRPNLFLGVTATNMPFADETVYTRMLPLELDQISSYGSDIEIQAYLNDNINGLWKGMFDCIDEVLAALNRNKQVEVPSQTRLADFAIFCARIKDVDFIDGKELMAGLENLVNRQKKVLEENSPLIDVINIWIQARPDGDDKFYSIAQLFPSWQRVASLNRIDWKFGSAQGLSRHVEMLQPQLIENYGVTVRSFRENGREIKKYKFEKRQLRVH